MVSGLSDLSDIERDALAEIANIGVSRAAASLRQMVGEQVLLSVPAVSIVDRKDAARLVERGNAQRLVAGACLATIANVLRKTMRMSLPAVIRGDGQKMFDVAGASEGDLVLFLYIDFTIRKRDIRGFIALLMDLPSITALKKIMRDFIASMDEQSRHVS